MIYRNTRIDLLFIFILLVVAGGLSVFVGRALALGRPGHAAVGVVLLIVILRMVFRISDVVMSQVESVDPIDHLNDAKNSTDDF